MRIANGVDNSPFAKLSKELRDIIYAYALPDPLDVLEISHLDVPEDLRTHDRPKIHVTQLCSQMREEALHALVMPYKLCFAFPVELYPITYPSSFIGLLESAATSFQQLPLLFISKPTTIDLQAIIGIGAFSLNHASSHSVPIGPESGG